MFLRCHRIIAILDATIIKLFHLRVNVLDHAILRAILLALTLPIYLRLLFFDKVFWQREENGGFFHYYTVIIQIVLDLQQTVKTPIYGKSRELPFNNAREPNHGPNIKKPD